MTVKNRARSTLETKVFPVGYVHYRLLTLTLSLSLGQTRRRMPVHCAFQIQLDQV